MFFLFKQKSAYEKRISNWSSDVCSADLILRLLHRPRPQPYVRGLPGGHARYLGDAAARLQRRKRGGDPRRRHLCHGGGGPAARDGCESGGAAQRLVLLSLDAEIGRAHV